MIEDEPLGIRSVLLSVFSLGIKTTKSPECFKVPPEKKKARGKTEEVKRPLQGICDAILYHSEAGGREGLLYFCLIPLKSLFQSQRGVHPSPDRNGRLIYPEHTVKNTLDTLKSVRV